MRLRWVVLAVAAWIICFILALLLYNLMHTAEAEGVTYALAGHAITQDALLASKEETIDLLKAAFNRPN